MYTPYTCPVLPYFNRYQACNPNGGKNRAIQAPTVHNHAYKHNTRQDTSHSTPTIPQEQLYIIIHRMQGITQPKTCIQASNTYIHQTVQVDFK